MALYLENMKYFYHTKESEHLQNSRRFTIAIYIYACMETIKYEYMVTSEFLLGGITVNTAVIRTLL